MMGQEKQTVVVTGVAGYIGSALAARLIAEGFQVVGVDNLSRGNKRFVPKEVIFVQQDVTDTRALQELVQKHQPRAIFHLAALKSVPESEAHPARYAKNNLGGTLAVAEAAALVQARVIFSSSAAVYHPKKDAHQLYREDDPLGSLSVYGKLKAQEEELLTWFAAEHGFPVISLRYFNVAGDAGLLFEDPEPENVFPILAKAVAAGETFSIFGTDYDTPDGTPVRDYIHLTDLVDAHLKALTAPAGVYNLGTERGVSVRELVDAFEQVVGRPVAVHEAPRRPGDPAQVLADATKARKILNWQAHKTVHDMVVDTWRVYGKKT